MMTKLAARASSADVSAAAAPASRALLSCLSSMSHAITGWPCLRRCLSMASPMRPAPTSPTRDLFASVISPLPSSGLRLQHRRERLGRICELAGIDWHTPFDEAARDSDFALRIDAGCVGEASAVELERQPYVTAERPAHMRAGIWRPPPHALDVEVVLLGPERGRDVVSDIAARSIAPGNGTVLQSVTPILQANRAVGTGKTGAVASGKNGRIDRAGMVVNEDSVLRGQFRGLGQSVVRSGADADDDQIRRNRLARARFNYQPPFRQVAQIANGRAEPDVDTVGAVARFHQRRRLRVADAGKDARGDLDHCGGNAEFGRRSRHFKSDQPTADHD